MINPDFAFNGMRLSDSRVNENLYSVFLILLFKAYLSIILPIMVYQSLFCYFQLIHQNNIFVIKNSNGYWRVLLARPTLASPKWIPVFLMQPLSMFMNSCQFKLLLYHLSYGRFFDTNFMADSPLKIFATPSSLLPWHDYFPCNLQQSVL